MTYFDIVTIAKIFILVTVLQAFFQTKWGERVGSFFPLPFWVYFLSILGSTVGFFPKSSAVYPYFSSLVLSAAIFLMLVGTQVKDIFSMGPQASMAMGIAASSIFFSSILSFALLGLWLPADADSAIGALLGTWIGGSANMISVKEILSLSDETLGSLVLVDTVLSYSWMALLFLGIQFQKQFDRSDVAALELNAPTPMEGSHQLFKKIFLVFMGLAIGKGMVLLGSGINKYGTFLTSTAWALLISTVLATVVASTKLNRVGAWGSSQVGSFLLYCVLVTIGAKSSLMLTQSLQHYFVLGVLILLIHGVLLFFIGWKFRIPLSLLAIASQANIGGMISAPVLAEAYRKGTAHFGVLMGILGTLMGTYVGVLGGGLCRWLKTIFS